MKMYKKLTLTFTFILSLSYLIIGQNKFKLAMKLGPVFSNSIFYRGIEADANENRSIESGTGYETELHIRLESKKKMNFSVNFSYTAFSLKMKEFVRFPDDVLKKELSYFYSKFDVKNIGIGIHLGKKVYKNLIYNVGLQYNFPLSDANGYLFLAAQNKIDRYYDYNNKSQIQLKSGFDVTVLTLKNIDFSIGPQFSIFLNKDPETYLLKNQLRKYYFSLLFGINFK